MKCPISYHFKILTSQTQDKFKCTKQRRVYTYYNEYLSTTIKVVIRQLLKNKLLDTIFERQMGVVNSNSDKTAIND